MSSPVRLGLVGLGNIGAYHAKNILAGQAGRVVLAAVCDADPDRLAAYATPTTCAFRDPAELFTSGAIDAVLIATPHWTHPELGAAAFAAGLHVLVEKPIAVHQADAARLIAAWKRRAKAKRPVFAAMFNQRTDPFFLTIRRLVRDGELGAIRRVSWTITNWFRSAAYYASSEWRATWRGEGGGVLLNQCPHNLDLMQWIFGPPKRVTAFCRFGRYHDIEVEDDVTAYLEFADGLTGTFVTTTGEAPGTNRLEIAGERGRLVYENDALTFHRNAVPMSEFSRSTTENFATPPCDRVDLPTPANHGGQHNAVLANFADAILDGAPLIAPGEEGIHSVALANAMLMSTWLERPIELPLNGDAYELLLRRRIAASSSSRVAAKPEKPSAASVRAAGKTSAAKTRRPLKR